ncbi:MAG: 3-deoxy-7-phosphoheptulonate synthase [bacterium]|nr:3-deoxy-7-phosphoheptulonate synthase [bacterium]
MNADIIGLLPTPEGLQELYPVTKEHKIDEHRREIERVLSRQDSRRLIIAGPCSAYPFSTVDEYADRFARLREELSEKLLLVQRVYIQKPRTISGWTGPSIFPDPKKSADIAQGIFSCREMMCRVALRNPIYDEMLHIENHDSISPVLSGAAIGARSTENADHRSVASGMDMPIGIKNPTSGDITIGVNGVRAAQMPRDFPYKGKHLRTHGNPYAHLILRGGIDGPNYSPYHIAQADMQLREHVQNPAIIVDASHDNSLNGHGKDPTLQEHVLLDVTNGIQLQREEYELVAGFMLESNIKGGKQGVSDNMDPHVSITDACLSFEDTERVLRELANKL